MDHRGLVLGVFLIFVCFSTILKAQKDGSCETQCGDSCCPHENAVCCEGDLLCCKQGQTCLSSIDTCIGLKPSTRGNVTLHSEKATPVAGIYCPSGTTPCEGGCCPYDDGVCCNDGSCCPNGYTCTKDACVSDGVKKTKRSRIAGKDPAINMMGRKLKDMGIQICPDKLHLCPGNADCCRKDDGQWDCCPKTSNLLTGECCTQIGFIYWCCTDLVPKCHWWGCWWS